MQLKPGHQALTKGRTVFLKTVIPPSQAKRLLQPASTNRKLGGGKLRIEKGRWRGMPLYQLLLEERATCPSSCNQWDNCYGNNMYLAKRINHRGPELVRYLRHEVAALAKAAPGGFVIRLHVLGDFYSKAYVRFWHDALARHLSLRLFGYTHRLPGQGDGIGEAIEAINSTDRCWIRFSDRGGLMSANVGAATGPEDIQCPEEVGKTKSCLTCGLCWQTRLPIKFLTH